MTEPQKSAAFALVPLRNRKPIFGAATGPREASTNNDDDGSRFLVYPPPPMDDATKDASGGKQQQQHPFIPFSTDTASSSSSSSQDQAVVMVVGRMEFMQAVWDACLRTTTKNQQRFDGTTPCHCRECCKANEKWICRLPRKMFRIGAAAAAASSKKKKSASFSILPSQYPAKLCIISNHRRGEKTVATLRDDSTGGRLGKLKVGDILQIQDDTVPANAQPTHLEFQVFRIAVEQTQEVTCSAPTITTQPRRSVAAVKPDEKARVAATSSGSSSSTKKSLATKTTAKTSRKSMVANSAAMLSPRSRYGAALQVLDGTTINGEGGEEEEEGKQNTKDDETKDNEDDDDDDSSLASQQLESQEAFEAAAIANEQEALKEAFDDANKEETSSTPAPARLSSSSSTSTPPEKTSPSSSPLAPHSPNAPSVSHAEVLPQQQSSSSDGSEKVEPHKEGLQSADAMSETVAVRPAYLLGKPENEAPTNAGKAAVASKPPGTNTTVVASFATDTAACETRHQKAGGEEVTVNSDRHDGARRCNEVGKVKSHSPQAASLVLANKSTTTTAQNFAKGGNSGIVASSKQKNVANKKNSSEQAASSTATTVQPQSKPESHDAGKAKKFVLYLVPIGRDMSKSFINGDEKVQGLRKFVEERGATVLDSFDKTQPPWPTHFVISERIETNVVPTVARCLGFSDENEMSVFLKEHGIVCAKRKWASKGSVDTRYPFEEPKPQNDELAYGFGSIRSRKRSRPQTRGNESAPRNVKQKVEVAPGIVRNQKLSEIFRQLSKRYRECPLDDSAQWKSYSFNLISGRLRHLSFDVVNDPDVMKRLKQVRHIGSSSIEIVEDYLGKGRVSRLEEFEKDKQCLAMRAMTNIWGVGPKKALELVNAKYENIEQVRSAIKKGKLKLDRNQYIGVECYEDIMEEMSRAEVEAITDTIAATVKGRFPSAELTIMGSYRRGKETCGDADILITHPSFRSEVPSKNLGRIMDELKEKGLIVHHLTFIDGMKHQLFESLPESAIPYLTSPDHYGRKKDKKDKPSSSMWMGIVNSPFVRGRRRRVDIKWYPHRERIYASLYFTGNGFFNRSMRLWATQKFGLRLSDHGMFKRDTDESVLVNPSSEKEVFDKLDLIWKEPTERDCFDAVQSKQGESVARILDGLSDTALKSDMGAEKSWIN